MAKAKKKKSKIQKGKVTVPAVKIIMFCSVLIVLSVAMLFVVTYKPSDAQEEPVVTAQVIEKEDSKKSEDIKEEKIVSSKAPEKTVVEEKKESTEKKASSSTAKTETTQKPESSSKTTVASTQKSESQKSDSTSKSQTSTAQKTTQSATTQKNAQVSSAQTSTTQKSNTSTTSTAQKSTATTSTASSTTTTTTTKSAASKFNFPKAVNNAQLVFLFDDGGQNAGQLKKFLDLPFPFTVAVLPNLPDTSECARLIVASGNELMLHQPMQAQNLNVNPGAGAITPDMNYAEIQALVKKNLAQLPGVKGLNNHEGSLITSDEHMVEAVLSAALDSHVFFLDSRTTVETKVPSVSMSLGTGWYERNGFFLDNEKTRTEFLTQLRKNLDIANKTGNVIMIAHIWSADYLPALLMEVYPELKAQGYVFKTVSTSNGQKK